MYDKLQAYVKFILMLCNIKIGNFIILVQFIVRGIGALLV